MPNVSATLVSIATINDSDRIRRDYGDIPGLAESIKTNGLIQPIVLNRDNVLIAGGRRLRAMRSLGWTEAPAVYMETLDEAQLRQLETEENVRRQDFHWTEKVLAIDRVHSYRATKAALAGDNWNQRMTGELLNCTQANVSYCVTIARYIREGDKEIIGATGLTDALAILLKRQEDAANARLVSISTVTIPSTSKVTTADLLAGIGKTPPTTSKHSPVNLTRLSDDGEMPGGAARPETIVPLSAMLHNSDALTFLNSLAPDSVDCIITDPPYGIDMANLSQENRGMSNISMIEDTHHVEDNKTLLTTFIAAAYRVLKPDSFCVLWYDISLESHLRAAADAAGFAAQSWPLIWLKTHTCINQQASVNFTKNYELALVLRKGKPRLLTPQSSSLWSGSIEDTKAVLGGHPFVKPAGLWRWLYSAICPPGSTVLDPFAGAGSSTVAAVSHGLRPIACEIDPKIYAMQVVNVQNHFRTLDPNVKFA